MGKDEVRGEQERRRWLRELEAECHSEEGWAPTGGGTQDADADAMKKNRQILTYSCGQKCQPALFKPKIKRVCANFGMVATVHSIRELGTLSLNK